jgi:hypothetical protein
VNAQDILAAGGTAEVEVFTKFQYVGNGVLTANATIDVTSNGSSIGSENHSGSAKNPGYNNGGQIEAGYDYFPVPLADFKAGNQIEVDLTGQVTAVVNVCRAPWGAFARWTAGMPVLRLTP